MDIKEPFFKAKISKQGEDLNIRVPRTEHDQFKKGDKVIVAKQEAKTNGRTTELDGQGARSP